VTVTNTGNQPLTGGNFAFGGGTPQPFAHSGTGGCGATLAVGTNCTYTVHFAPATAVAFSRTLTVTYTHVTPIIVTLTGTGVATRGTLTITPLTITLPAGSFSGTGTVTVTNNANSASSVAITADSVSGAGASLTGIWFFTEGTDNCLGTNLAPGASCTVGVSFTRVFGTGTHTGTISFTDTANGSPQSAVLTGIEK
jgi:hypothetical protein